MIKTAAADVTLSPTFRPKQTQPTRSNPLGKSAVVQYFIGWYLGTRTGLCAGYPTQKYAQGYDWDARVNGDKLIVTRTVSCLDRYANESALRDLHVEHDRIVEKLRSITAMIVEFETVIAQTEVRIQVADQVEIASLEALRDQYYRVLEDHSAWQKARKEALEEVLVKMRELASKSYADPVEITVDLGEYV